MEQVMQLVDDAPKEQKEEKSYLEFLAEENTDWIDRLKPAFYKAMIADWLRD